MESESAKQINSQLEAVRSAPWLDGYDREFLRNLFAEEPNFDYLSTLTNRRINKILEEAEFKRKHPNATTWA